MHRLGAALAAAALISAAAAPAPLAAGTSAPRGYLLGISGPRGCVAQHDVDAPRSAGYPARQHCAPGRGLRQVHHVMLSPDERFVYTAAGYEQAPPNDDGAIGIYRRSNDGSIRQQGCIKRPKPVHGREGCGTARAIEGARFLNMDRAGRFAYVGGPSGIAIFSRDARRGTLTQLPGAKGCISEYAADQPSCAHLPYASAIEDIQFSPDERFAYVVANYNDAILVFSRDSRTGRLTALPGKQGCVAWVLLLAHAGCTPGRALDRARSVTTSPDGRYVYLSTIADSIVVFRRSAQTGHLRQLSGRAGCIVETAREGCSTGRAILGSHRLTLTRDGRFAYLAGKQDDSQGRGSTVASFRRDVRTGALTQLAGKAACFVPPSKRRDGCAVARVILGAHQVALDPTERFAYVSSDRADFGGIGIFRRDPRTGRLRQLQGRWGCLAPTDVDGCSVYRRTGGMHFLVMTRDGRFAYAASENQYALLAFRRRR